MALFNKINPLKIVGKIIDNDELLDATTTVLAASVKRAAKHSVAETMSGNVLSTPPPPPVPGNMPKPLSVLIAVNGQQYGPYERATLIEMINSGSLTRETFVFIDGMPAWQPAVTVPEVAALFGNPSAPVPPAPFAPVPPIPGVQSPNQTNNQSNVMSNKLNALVEAAVADGEISDIERQVLVRNAQAEGISMDEFVVMLEARLFERRKQLAAEQKIGSNLVGSPTAPRPANQYGELRKCPACGAVIEKMSATECPQCGYELRSETDIDCTAANSIQPLLDKLDAIDREMQNGNQLKMMFGGQAAAYQRKSQTIAGYIVPPSKEAVRNFLLIAGSAYKSAPFGDPCKKAWKNKAEEVIRRAKIKHANDDDMIQTLQLAASDFGLKYKKL